MPPSNLSPFRSGNTLRVLLPAGLFWLSLVGGAAYLLYERSTWAEKYDRHAMEEWVKELRPFRKNLTELLEEYLASPTPERREELQDQLNAMAEPIRTFPGMLPLFPELYRIQIRFPQGDHADIGWVSPVPLPHSPGANQEIGSEVLLQVKDSVHENVVVAEVRCDYRLHAYSRAELVERRRQRMVLGIGIVVLAGITLAATSVWLFVRRERLREISQLEAARALESAKNAALAEQLRAEQAKSDQEELERQLLEEKLKVAEQETRASEAEKTSLQMRSELFAGIGIMAGSYAHNIKNLLVRPNDLLTRCLEVDGIPSEQTVMLEEVRSTLGTVTERLQQILKTVRRDPSRSEMTHFDLAALIRDTEQTWSAMGREKWKLAFQMELPAGPVWIRGDHSHLQQAIENLLFNARDAGFEMRNHVRDAARAVTEPVRRKQALIDAASWRGQVSMRLFREANQAVLEIRDNGIGMTPEVREQCIQTHFSTKRDNAIFEGFTAGMGLGLSFVVVVLEHHRATMEIESEPFKGALFRIRFPLDEEPGT